MSMAQQLLGGNGGAACVCVDGVEQAVQACQRVIDQAADCPERIVRWYEVLQLGHREQ
jgi:hypothetical protein